MKRFENRLGLGIGWRPELAHLIARRSDFGFVEVIAENINANAGLPRPLQELRERGVTIIPHGVTLSLGGADPISSQRVDHLARLAEILESPFVSEHIAFVRAGEVEIGHLTPLPRTRDALEILIENVETTTRLLPVPLALENIASLFDWPDAEMNEAEFISRVVERTNTLLLLDISNSYANAHNRGLDALNEIRGFPLERLAYLHIGGGIEHDRIVHDTHSDPILPGALELLQRFCVMRTPPGVLLERDENFAGPEEINLELDRIKQAIEPKRNACFV
jgi:uncharacterized protein (UPF0276 family)